MAHVTNAITIHMNFWGKSAAFVQIIVLWFMMIICEISAYQSLLHLMFASATFVDDR